MRLVCHIGTPKTASTFLQNSFAANAAWLQRHGVLYPDLLSRDANHITLFYAAHERLHDFARDHGLHSREDVLAFRRILRRQLERQVAKAPPGTHTMLVSSENLTGNLTGRPGISNLRELFDGLFSSIEIVVYLRRQDEAFLSMYGEYMRRGFNGMTFGEFTEACMSRKSPVPYLYYRRVLKLWREMFGQEALKVRIYSPHRLAGGGILEDFMQLLFGAEMPELSGFARSSQNNTGLSAPALEFLRLMHPHIPNRKDGVLNPQRRRLQARIDSLPATPRPCMAPGRSQQIMRHFAGANAWVADTFFPGAQEPLFPDSSTAGQPGNLGWVPPEQFAAFTAHLLD